jgi:DNA-binding response OmpR family regulator
MEEVTEASAALRRILIVDDDEAGRYVKARILTRAGFAVSAAGTGADALGAVQDDPPDAVLLDVRLPDADGLEICRRIKETHPGLPVLQTSAAFTAPRDKALGLSGGADGYLIEPVEPEELVATVFALLRNRASEDELRRQLAVESGHRATAEEALRHAQKLDALGQLTGGIAHDFNNFLVVVLGNLEKIEKGLRGREALPREELLRAAVGAQMAAQDCHRLTRKLLAFARSDVMQPVVTDVNDAVKGVQPLLQRALGEHITFEIALAERLWPCRIDAGQLEAALLNLTVNARDAMPDGGVCRVITANVSQPADALPATLPHGHYVCISVRDTGTGMGPEVLAHAFEPFFTTKDIGKGSGLGLAQVYGFLRQSGGDVAIDSAVGKGTDVRLYLPRSDESVPMREMKAPALEPRPERGSETILVVEDNTLVRDYVSETISDLGYRVFAVGDGREALEVVSGPEKIDLIFTDVVLPNGLSGIGLAEAARKQRPELKVLLTSGYPRGEEIEGRSIAGYWFLAKPYMEAELAATLRGLFSAT